MDKKAINEIRKLIKPDSCIDRIRACYVNEEGEVIREIHDSLAAMEKESMEKYCEILRGAMSGKLGRNLFNMEFPLEEESEGGRQQLLYRLAQSELKNDELLTLFFMSAFLRSQEVIYSPLISLSAPSNEALRFLSLMS